MQYKGTSESAKWMARLDLTADKHFKHLLIKNGMQTFKVPCVGQHRLRRLHQC